MCVYVCVCMVNFPLEWMEGIDIVFQKNKSMKGFSPVWGIGLNLGNQREKMSNCSLK